MRVPLTTAAVSPVFMPTNPASYGAGLDIEVVQRGTEVRAEVFDAETGGSVLSQPLVTDKSGRIEGRNGEQCWVPEGTYDLLIDGNRAPWDAAGGAVVGRLGVLNISDYVDRNPDAAEQSSAFQSALSEIQARGGGVRLVVPKGGYRVDSGLTYSGSDLRVELAPGANIDFSHADDDAVLFTFSGVEASKVSLSANATAGTSVLEVTAGEQSQFEVGDWVKVGADTRPTPGTNPEEGTDTFIAEIGKVKSVESGKINLETRLDASYVTSDSAYVRKLSMLQDIAIDGGKFLGGGKEANHDLVAWSRCETPTITGVSSKKFVGRVTQMYDCVSGRANGNNLYADVRPTPDGYGFSVTGASRDCTHTDNTVYNFRHCYEQGSTESAPGLQARNIVSDNHFFGSAGAACSEHSSSNGTTYTSNTYYDCAFGISVRSARTTIADNEFDRCGQPVWCRNQTTTPSDYAINGNRLRANSEASPGILVSNDNLMPEGGSLTAGIKIADNVIDSPGSVAIGVWAQSESKWRYVKVSVTGNVITGVPSGETAIHLIGVDYADASDNDIEYSPDGTGDAGIRFQDCTGSKANGNTIRSLVEGQGSGIYMTDGSKECGAADNRVKGCSRGIRLENDVTWTTIGSNNLRGNTTPLALGTGEGNSAPLADDLGVVARMETVSTNAGKTFAVFTAAPRLFHTGTLTADKEVVLSTTGAYRGASLRVTRTGSGAFKLKVGALIELDPNEWAEVIFDGTAWKLSAAGGLT